jgi:hypothetical protein
MAKRRILKHEPFGVLELVVSNLWKREMPLTIFDREWTVELLVNIHPDEGVEQNQVQAFAAYQKQVSAIAKASEEAILKYYQSVCDDYRGRAGVTDPHDKRLPLADSTSDIARLVEPRGVTFPYVRPRPTFGLLFECTWEEEHGLAVKWEAGKITEVGYQDIVI